MQSIAWSRVCRSPFLLGCLVGALISLGVPRTVTAAGSASPHWVAGAYATCAVAEQAIDDLPDYWQATHQAVFGTPLTAALPTFQLRSALTSANWTQYHKGFNDGGGTFGAEFVLFHQWDKELDRLTAAQRADINGAGMVTATVMGVLHGVGESETRFHGMYLSFTAEGGERVAHLIPLGEVPSETIKAVAEANAISATAAQTGSMTPRQLCLFLANAAYKNCIDEATLARVNCLADAEAEAAALAAACALGAVIPVIGWGGAAACIALVMAGYYRSIRICNSTYDNSVFTCKNALNLERLRCAVEYAQ